jgi:phage baseplate assembly protein W
MILESINQHKTEDWQLSIDHPGHVVTHIDSLAQSVRLILMTDPGTDTMRPEFGLGLTRLIGQPITKVRSELAKRGLSQFQEYMPEINFLRFTVSASTSLGKISVTAEWEAKTTGQAEAYKTTVYL